MDPQELYMSVGKHIEITSDSPVSFEEAIKDGIRKASETVQGICSAWVKDQHVVIENGAVTAFRVNMKVTFLLK
jgi:flavin-binding protein dodecin